MKLLVIVLCLLSERFLIHSISYQRFCWFGLYSETLLRFAQAKKLPNNSWALLALFVAPPVLAAFIVYLLMASLFWGIGGLLMNIVIFYYCLGPHNPFYPVTSPDESGTGAHGSVPSYLAQVNCELFSVIFWYVLLGPIAALFYRFVSLSQQIEPIKDAAIYVTQILEWIPARMTAILYLLVGNFQSGFKLFSQYVLAGPQSNNKLLELCGAKAAHNHEEKELSMVSAEQVVEHAAVLLLVIIALMTLASWM
jgi:AmpE protein